MEEETSAHMGVDVVAMREPVGYVFNKVGNESAHMRAVVKNRF